MNKIPFRLLALIGCLALVLAFWSPPAPVAAQAGPLSEADVRAAVETWVRGVPVEARPDAVITTMEPYWEQGEIVAYIAHLAGGGFCLAGADVTVLPVYFYSPQATYDPANPAYQAILHEIAARKQAAQQALTGPEAPAQLIQDALQDRAVYWQELIAGHTPARPAAAAGVQAEPSYLVLPLTARWDQGAPYFDQLPVLTPSTAEHTVVGCNATATAQVMYYWKWPPSGTSSKCINYDYRWRTSWDSVTLNASVTIPADYNGRLRYDAANHLLQMNGYWDGSIYGAAQTLSAGAAYQNALATLWSHMNQSTKQACADFGAATYNWSIMRDTNTEPPDAAGSEAAKFSAHTAIGVNSGLGVWYTGSFFGNDVAGLAAYFRYDPDALYTAPPSDGGPGADISSITAEITWGRVAGLGGSNAKDEGHAWVIDGYDKSGDPNRLFHMNFGWAGGSDGWYTFDSAPFPLNHDMMTRIAPTVVRFAAAAAATSGDGSPATPYQNITQAAASVPTNDTLMLRAGSEYNFSGTLVINRAVTLEGYGATIR
ncbi:MAG: C10 family peptidase [Chloroflexi bacterium]|nr:C10 family peptidase [Chloroflexota bacterium]